MLKDNYGKIVNGKLETADALFEGYKPIVYAPVPQFDQELKCVFQADPVDRGDDIFIGVEIKDLPASDDAGSMPI